MKNFFYTITAMTLILVVLSTMSFPQQVEGAEVSVDTTVIFTLGQGGVSAPSMVWVSDQTGFLFYLDAEGDIAMASTTDGGTTWQAGRTVDSVNTTDAVSVGVWWDGWTHPGTTTQYIHIVTTDTGVDDTYYTRYDITNNTLSTTVLATTQAGTCSRGSSCYPAITKASNNVLYMATTDGSDNWVVSCSTTCTTAGNWSERTGGFYPTNADMPVLLAPVAGTNNVILIWNDIVRQSLFYNVYSATSSSWTNSASATGTIATNIDTATTSSTYEANSIGMAISTSTGKIGLTVVDDANNFTTQDHDIKFFYYSSSTGWVSGTNVRTDVSGGLIGAKLSYDEQNDIWYSIYLRRSTIGVTNTGNAYYSTSSNDGTTWSSESPALLATSANYEQFSASPTSFERIGASMSETTSNTGLKYVTVYDINYTGGGGEASTPMYIEDVYFLQ